MKITQSNQIALINNLIPIALLMFLSFFAKETSAQEVVMPLSSNPVLQRQSAPWNPANRKSEPVNYWYLRDTLSIPFVEDFTRNRLKAFNFPVDFVIDTINRSINLGKYVDTLRLNANPTWIYNYDPATGEIDSAITSVDTLILNDDLFDVLLRTDTLIGYPVYKRLYFDTLGVLDTMILPADIELVYSKYRVANPDPNARWLDNMVYLNSALATNKLSTMVATFDGMDEFGNPYSKRVGGTFGGADTLTSKYLNLGSKTPLDSVFLSFFFQPQGLGDYPNLGDSLILEFRLTDTQWQKVWGVDGFSMAVPDPQFERVVIYILDPVFLSAQFQFRFRNYATITGNNDHWHLDYVLVDEKAANLDLRDVAFTYPTGSLLRTYSMMPWNQFSGFESQELRNDFQLSFRNNFDTDKQMTFSYRAKEQLTNTPLFSTIPFSINFTAQTDYTQSFSIADFLPDNSIAADSVVVRVSGVADQIIGTRILENDTLHHDQNFFNILAYDDGTAEKAYGLQGSGIKRFALRFHLNQPDTLRAIAMHFTHIFEDVEDMFVGLYVWNKIDTSNTGQAEAEDTLYFHPQFIRTMTHLIDERNGFTIYKLDSPIIVSGELYIGWQQADERNIQLGFDINTRATNRMFYYANGQWFKSLAQGSPMIRAIVGKEVPLISTPVKPGPVKEQSSISLYPNPASNNLWIKLPADWDQTGTHITLLDLSGKVLYQELWSPAGVNLKNLRQGLYLINAVNPAQNKSQSRRFLKLER